MTQLVNNKWQIGPIDVPVDAEMTGHKGRSYPKVLSDARRLVQQECFDLMNSHIDGSDAGKFMHSWLLEEFLLNAMSHGNDLDPQKIVELQLIVNEVREGGVRKIFAELHILDEGSHFSLQEVPDPTSPEFMFRPTGRGITGTLGLLERRYGGGGIYIDHEKPTGAATGKRVIVSWKREEPLPEAVETEA